MQLRSIMLKGVDDAQVEIPVTILGFFANDAGDPYVVYCDSYEHSPFFNQIQSTHLIDYQNKRNRFRVANLKPVE